MICLGILFLIYYLVIRFYTGRKDSTFLPFWLWGGIFCILAGIVLAFMPDRISRWSWIVIGIPFVIFILAEIVICSAMIQTPDEHLEYLIVLGAQVRGKRVSNSLARRLDKAQTYLEQNPDTKVIVTGGKGKGEDITEAEAMRRYLVEKGIANERIRKEDQSTSTWQNLEFSQAFIRDRKKPIGIVTNNFHVYRATLMAKRQGYVHVQGLVASSNPVLMPNYMVREFFACMSSWFIYKDK